MIGCEVAGCVNCPTYLKNFISPCGLVYEETLAQIQKAQFAFANMSHLWST